MRHRLLRHLVSAVALAFSASPVLADDIDLGSAGSFAVLAGSSVSNTGPSIISGGHVGVSPGARSTGSLITGFPPGIVVSPFTTHQRDALAAQAHQDLSAAYVVAAAMPVTMDLSGQNLGGRVLQPGVYRFLSSAQLTGTLTLDALGDPNALFVFQIAGSFAVDPGASVVAATGGLEPGNSVFWQVRDAAVLGEEADFSGHILALGSINLGAGANILNGSALSRDGNVILNANFIAKSIVSIPEPTTITLAIIGGALLGLPVLEKLRARRFRRRRQESGISPAGAAVSGP